MTNEQRNAIEAAWSRLETMSFPVLFYIIDKVDDRDFYIALANTDGAARERLERALAPDCRHALPGLIKEFVPEDISDDEVLDCKERIINKWFPPNYRTPPERYKLNEENYEDFIDELKLWIFEQDWNTQDERFFRVPMDGSAPEALSTSLTLAELSEWGWKNPEEMQKVFVFRAGMKHYEQIQYLVDHFAALTKMYLNRKYVNWKTLKDEFIMSMYKGIMPAPGTDVYSKAELDKPDDSNTNDETALIILRCGKDGYALFKDDKEVRKWDAFNIALDIFLKNQLPEQAGKEAEG